MIAMTVSDFVLTMAVGLLVMGLISLAAGMILLVTRVAGGDVRTIAKQSVQLAQKGIAEDVAGLVGNAGALLEALNSLVKSVAGVGVFLILIGFALLAGSYALVMTLR